MKTPRLRRGGGIASSSSLVIFVLVLLSRKFYLWLSFRVGAMGTTSFLGFSCPNLLLVFLNLLFLGSFYIFFRKYWDFLWVFFYFIFSVPYFGLACDHVNSFLCFEG